jgi:hypothetical protein
MKMTKKEKEVYKLYAECVLKAMDFAISEKWQDSVFYDGMALGIEKSAFIFIPFRSEFAALFERTYQVYVDYVNGNSEYEFNEVVTIIKEGRA